MKIGIGSARLRRAATALAVALPVLAFGADAAADSFSFGFSTGWHRGSHHYYHRHHHHHHGHYRGYRRHHVYAPPVVVRRTVVVEQPLVVPYSAPCTSGLWRQLDGSVVEGVACRRHNGTWQLQ